MTIWFRGSMAVCETLPKLSTKEKDPVRVPVCIMQLECVCVWGCIGCASALAVPAEPDGEPAARLP